MAKITFCGDIHGDIPGFKKLFESGSSNSNWIVVGDVGIGFRDNSKLPISLNAFYPRCRFITGNHDCPTDAKNSELGYLGRYGITEEGIFFVSGAHSIDWKNRKTYPPYIDWWPDEQLSYGEFQCAFDLYKETKPDIVVTHDCPRSLYPEMLKEAFNGSPGTINENITSHALQSMWEFHQPKLWVFGHFHTKRDIVVGGTRFICLDIMETKEIDL